MNGSKPRVLVIDNYDSFVYVLVQYLGELGCEPVVLRNDSTIATLTTTDPDALVVSPGPGTPDKAGICKEAIEHFAHSIPVLGVCLGHQCIAEVYGAKVVRAQLLMHGKTSAIQHDEDGIFSGIPNPMEATRYHSLIVDPLTIPPVLEVSAKTDDGTVMGIRHQTLPVDGIQFHPESILTLKGKQLLANWLADV